MCSCNIEPEEDEEDDYDAFPMSDADKEAMYAAMYAEHLKELALKAGPTAKDWTDRQTLQFLRDLTQGPAEFVYIPVED